MPKKLTQEFVENAFKEKGWKLLDNYINAHTPMLCRCPECKALGNVTTKTWVNFKAGKGCSSCNKQNKYTHEQAKKIFKDKGWKLLGRYIKLHKKVKCSCNKGHIHKKTLRNLLDGQACTVCIRSRKRLTYEFVKLKFEEKGWELLQDFYEGCGIPMKCRCSEKHVTIKSLDNIKTGAGCSVCAGNAKLNIDYIKEYISRKYKVEYVSGEYCNNSSVLVFLCEYNHTFNKSWSGVRKCKSTTLCPECFKHNNLGKNSNNYKGGVEQLNLSLYKTYANRLEKYQEVFLIKQLVNGEILELLGVNCHYSKCGKTFSPTRASVVSRLKCINKTTGDQNLFCSEQCKKDCSTHGQQKYPKGFKPKNKNYRTHQTEWSNLVKANAKHTCEICGANKKVKLVGHHEIPVVVNELLSLDLDNGLCLCKTCHTKVHELPWCTISYLINCSLRKKR